MDDKRTTLLPGALQEFLEAIAVAPVNEADRDWHLIRCYAELQYQLNGGSKCAICRAHVRHVIPVLSVRDEGEMHNFACLCQRCFLAERALSQFTVMQIGQARVEFRQPRMEYELKHPRARMARPMPKNSVN
jgi:hypothetical protein